jgi:hypothetical protein
VKLEHHISSAFRRSGSSGIAAAHEKKFHFAIVHRSRRLSPSLRTTDRRVLAPGLSALWGAPARRRHPPAHPPPRAPTRCSLRHLMTPSASSSHSQLPGPRPSSRRQAAVYPRACPAAQRPAGAGRRRLSTGSRHQHLGPLLTSSTNTPPTAPLLNNPKTRYKSHRL